MTKRQADQTEVEFRLSEMEEEARKKLDDAEKLTVSAEKLEAEAYTVLECIRVVRVAMNKANPLEQGEG